MIKHFEQEIKPSHKCTIIALLHSPSLREDYASSIHLSDLSLGHVTSGANLYKRMPLSNPGLSRVSL